MELSHAAEFAKRKEVLLVTGVVVVLIACGVVLFVGRGSQAGSLPEDGMFLGGNSMSDGEDMSQDPADLCEVHVDIGGAGKEPDVFCVGAGEILGNVIELAGGLKDEACSKWVGRELNLAAVVEPNSKIYIPFEDDRECLVLDVAPGENDSGVGGGDGENVGKVSINNASQVELESLSGVGPSTAQKIIDGRPYGKLEDLMNVKGIGQSTYDKLKDGICL